MFLKPKFLNAFVSIIALLMLQLSVPTLYAQEQERETQQEEEASSDNVRKRVFNVNTDSESTYGADFLVMITLIGFSIFIASAWKYKPMSWDMRLAMAAGIAHLGAVILAITNTKSKISAENFEVVLREDGSVNNLQLDALKEQKKSYESLRDLADTKRKLELAAATAYAAAAGVAYYKFSQLSTHTVTCRKALVTNVCPAAQGILEKEVGLRWKLEPSAVKGQERLALIEARRDAIYHCQGQAPPKTIKTAVANAYAACGPLFDHQLREEPVTYTDDEGTEHEINIDKYDMIRGWNPSGSFWPINTPTEKKYSKPNFLDIFKEMIMPKAEAFSVFGAIGLGSAAIAAYKTFQKVSHPLMDELMLDPKLRGHLYSSATAISLGAAALSKSSADSAKKNIKRLDAMIERMENLQNMAPVQNTVRRQNTALRATLQPLGSGDGYSLTSNGERLPCAGPKANPKKGCPSPIRTSDKERMTGVFGDGIGNIVSLSRDVSNGISGQSNVSTGTLNAAEELGNQGALASKFLRNAEKEVNKNLKDLGQKPIDFKNERKDLTENLSSRLGKRLEKSGVSSSGLASALGASPEGLNENIENKDIESLAKAAGVSSSASGQGISFDPSVVDKPDFDFSYEDESAEESVEFFDDSIDQSVYGKAFDKQKKMGGSSEIVGNKNVSLFKVISHRYIKSGIPKLLERVEALE